MTGNGHETFLILVRAMPDDLQDGYTGFRPTCEACDVLMWMEHADTLRCPGTALLFFKCPVCEKLKNVLVDKWTGEPIKLK